MPINRTDLKGRLDAVERRLQAIALLTAEPGVAAAPAVISGEERSALIRFFREVVHGGMDEQIWRAKHPKEHALLVRTCGTIRG